jgi:hypothetical protein
MISSRLGAVIPENIITAETREKKSRLLKRFNGLGQRQ